MEILTQIKMEIIQVTKMVITMDRMKEIWMEIWTVKMRVIKMVISTVKMME
jgi:hypothetical protein